MKKLMLTLILFMSLLLAKGTVTTTMGVNVREKPSASAPIVATIEKGETVPVIGKVASYYKVEIVQGESKKDTSIHVGKTGYLWAGRVDASNSVVIGSGTSLRSTPEYKNNGTPNDSTDDPNYLANIKAGAKIKIIEPVISWYQIKEGYFSAIAVEKE